MINNIKNSINRKQKELASYDRKIKIAKDKLSKIELDIDSLLRQKLRIEESAHKTASQVEELLEELDRRESKLKVKRLKNNGENTE